MTSFFAPAVRLMNRFNYPGRLALTGILAFAAVAFLLVSIIHHQQSDILAVRNEIAAVEVIAALHRQVKLIQEHRGISKAYLSGDASLLKNLQNRQSEVEKSIQTVDAIEKKHAGLLGSTLEWQAIKEEWTRLRQEVEKLPPDKAFQYQSALIERILRFQVTIADAGRLTLDDELDTFYLGSVLTGCLPDLMERLGKMRAKGTSILVLKQLSSEERTNFAVNDEMLAIKLGALQLNLGKAAHHAPALEPDLTAFSRDLGAAIQIAMRLVERDILGGAYAVAPGVFFERFTDAIDIGYREMFETIVPTLRQQLEDREARLTNTMRLQVGITLLFLLLLLYLGIGSYFTIIESVRRLSAGAARIAAGDLKSRIRLEGHDELTDVAHSFNTMAISLDKVMRDSRQINAELQAALDDARRADQTKDAFLANVSHELRTPLNAVIGLADLARRPNSSAAKRLEYLTKIADAGRTLSNLINDLLDLSKIAAGRMELHLTTFRIAELAERAKSIMSYRFSEKELSLNIDIDPALPVAIVGDSLRIEQLLLNLLSNAAKFTHAGGVYLRFRLVGRDENQLRLRIEVEDTGIGMSEEEIGRLFQPFTQADVSMTRRYGGTGLGLALCKQIAELMSGHIEVRSEPQKGSCFSVEIAIQAGNATEIDEVAAGDEADAQSIQYRNVHILAVDDQPMNREIVSELLESVGIAVRLAANGQQALDLLIKSGPQAFDLVLMDVQMPILDGLEATRRLRTHAEFAKLPVIALTAHTMEHEREASMAAGMVDHIGKPIDSGAFFGTLRRWISQEKQYQAPEGQHDTLSPATVVVRPFSLVEALNAIPGFDAAGGLSRFGGKEDRYLKWLAEFLETGADLPRQMEDALAAGNRESAAKIVHAYKGRVGTLGIGKLHGCVIELEKCIRAGDRHEQAMNTVAAEIIATRAALQHVLAQRDESQSAGQPRLKHFEWSESYSVGVPGIDDQHKRMVALVNQVADLHDSHVAFPGKAVHEVLSAMQEYSQTHFKSEEAYMREIGYTGLDAHCGEHAGFVEEMAALSVAASRGVLDLAKLHDYLSHWLKDHILQSDMAYRIREN